MSIDIQPELTPAPSPVPLIATCRLCGRNGMVMSDTYACAPGRSERCVELTLTRIADRHHREQSAGTELTAANLKRARRQQRNLTLIDRGAYR